MGSRWRRRWVGGRRPTLRGVESDRFDVTAAVADDRVLVRDVGPRDGLQAIDRDVALDVKIAMTNGLVAAGVPRVEAGSFVSPKAVPRMADSRHVFDAMPTGVSREALVVNAAGAHAAVEAGVDVLVGVISASDTFSHRNVRMSTAAAIAELATIAGVARTAGLPVSVDLSAAFGCAFEGEVPVETVADVAGQIAAAGSVRDRARRHDRQCRPQRHHRRRGRGASPDRR